MKIIEISIKLGATVNLGDYNNFRPEIGGKAAVEAFDDPDQVYAQLADFLEERMAQLVDDELERAGEEPRYATNLYTVWVSDVRKCVVVTRPHLNLPDESTWRDSDRWQSVRYGKKMRITMANNTAATIAQEKGYAPVWVYANEDLSSIPDLPDPGPAPRWVTNDLEHGLRRLNIPKDTWEKVGDLPHADSEYLEKFYRWYHDVYPSHINVLQMVEMFIAGETPWLNAAVPEGEGDDDQPENERFPDDWDEEE